MNKTKKNDFGQNFVYIFSNGLQTAPVMFPRAFTPMLKNLQYIEIIHLSAKITSINIWVSLGLSHSFLYSSQNVVQGYLFKYLSKTI